MAADDVAAAHYRQQVALARRAAARTARLWALVDPGAIVASWVALLARATALVSAAQLAAADAAPGYLSALAQAYQVTRRPQALLEPAALAGVASDGRDLDTLLYQPAVRTLTAIGAGARVDRALTLGRLDLDMIVRTQVADAGRVADGVALTTDRAFSGYVRMLSPPSCARCVILAGRRYRWNAGFARHPRCDCRHIPVAEDTGEDLRTNPRAYFDSLPPDEQDRVFTAAGARAIRDGANIAQVVNARKGARGLTPAGARLTGEEARALRGGRERGRLQRAEVFGRQLFTTTEGVTVRGLAGVRLGARGDGTRRSGQRYRSARAPRLMPESIYEIAGDDRDEAIRLLTRFGYLI